VDEEKVARYGSISGQKWDREVLSVYSPYPQAATSLAALILNAFIYPPVPLACFQDSAYQAFTSIILVIALNGDTKRIDEELNRKLFDELKESQIKLLSLSYLVLNTGHNQSHKYLQFVKASINDPRRDIFEKMLHAAIFTRVRVLDPMIREGTIDWKIECVHLRIDWLSLLVFDQTPSTISNILTFPRRTVSI
jgi:hypothetical protein